MNHPSLLHRSKLTVFSMAISILAFAAVSLFLVARAADKAADKAVPPAVEPVLSQEAKAVEDGLRQLESELNSLSRVGADSRESNDSRSASDYALSQLRRRLSFLKNWVESLKLDPVTTLWLRNHANIIEVRIKQRELRKRPAGVPANTIGKGSQKLAPLATGAISGVVTDSATTSSIANINVEIYNSTGAFITNTMTDGSGNYTSPAVLSTGNYFVRTTNDLGYLNEVYDNITCLFCNPTTGTPVAVTDGSTTSGIDFALVPGGRISGTVTNAGTAAPLVGVNVQIFDSGGGHVSDGFTDGSGNYTSGAGLPAGSYFARTNNGQGFIDKLHNNITCAPCNPTSGTAIAVTVGSTTSGINFSLNAGGRISGNITDAATAAAIPSVNVEIFNSTGAFVTGGFTDGSGNYTTGNGLLAGNYFARTNNSAGYVNKLYNNITCVSCNPTSGTPISVSAGATTPGINFSLNVGGRIAGTVTDAATSAPLAGVDVQILNSSGAFVTSGFTDNSGNYTSSSGLLPGNHFVLTNNSLGYVDEVYNNITCAPCNATSGTAVSVTAGMTTSGISFALNAGGRISGTVTSSATSVPLTNVNVEIINASGFHVSGGFTDGSGNYISSKGLTAGTYYARTRNSLGYIDEVYNNFTCLNCNPTSGTPITVTTGTTTPGINFALATGGRISGNVTDGATAAPLAGINVNIFNATGQFVSSGFTDGLGNYTTDSGLPSGNYFALTNNFAGYVNKLYNNITCMTCNVTSGTPIAVTAGSTASGISFSLNTGGRIAGTVTDAASAAPIANVNVQIVNSTGEFVANGNTNSAGQYLSGAGLTTGTYFVVTQNSLGYVNKVYNNITCAPCNPTSGTAVTVTAGTTTPGISFSLNAGGRIAGTVTDSSTSAPLANVNVQVFNSTGTFVASGFADSSGNYVTAEGLTAGTYYALTTNPFGYINELYNNITCVPNCNVTTGTPITVTAGATTSGINFALAAGGSISGTVTDSATTAGIAGVNVAIFDTAGFQVAFGVTDGVGNYNTNVGLPSGTYYARTFNSSGYINELYNNITCIANCNVTSGTPITVTAGATTSGINFALAAGGRISGTVTDAATTMPIASVQIEIFDVNNFFLTSHNTDSSGNYLSGDGLPAGTYFARTRNSLGYINKLYNNIICTECNATSGTPITITTGLTTSGINFALNVGGRISGAVTDAATFMPIANVSVEIFSSTGAFVSSGFTDSSGDYTTGGGVPTGSYFARTRNSLGYVEELYNNITCLNCNVTSGTAIAVTTGSTTSGINFALAAGGRISGTVTDAATSAPVMNLDVQIFNSSGSHVANGFTDSLGNYTSGSGLPAGNYFARTNSGSGYLNELYNNIDCSLGCNPTTGTAISVSVGATTSGINFALTAGGRISGTVTDAATMLPLANVNVEIFNSTGAFITNNFTDSAGNYTSAAGVPTGNYFARTRNSFGYINELYNNFTCLVNCNVTTGTPIGVTAGSTTSGINFALNLGGRISGTVTDAMTAAPLANVNVEIYDSGGVFVSGPVTDSAGNYLTPGGLPAGTYYAKTNNNSGYMNKLYNNLDCSQGCNPTTGTAITVTAGTTTSGISFALAAGGRISGTVTDSATSAPLANVNVQIFNSTGLSIASMNTDPSGNYNIGGLLAGNYFARTTNSLGYINELYNNITCVANCTVTTGTPITVTLGATTSGIDFALSAGGRIAGTVTDTATSLPIASVNISIINSSGTPIAGGVTDGSGNYISDTGLPGGNYFVRTNNSLGYVDEVYNNINCAPCNPTSGTAVSVTVGATTSGINFALAVGGLISGTVTDAATAAPLVNVNVQVFNSTGLQVTSVNTNSSGSYTVLTGLPAGNYFVRTNNSLGYVDEVYNNITCAGCSVTTGTPVAVTVGATTSGINFALAVGGQISGTVTDAATAGPLVNVNVQVHNSAGTFVTSVNTNSSGTYTILTGLPAGNYFVRTNNSLGYVDEVYNNINCAPCSVTTGTPVAVTVGATTSGINFALAVGGQISGTVIDAATSAPLVNVNVQVFNSTGASVTSVNTNSLGGYTILTGLLAGNYFVRTSNSLGYVDEVYNNITCAGCSVTTGTPVAVTVGATTSGINFALAVGGQISGTVTDAAAAPLVNVNVQVFNSTGFQVTSVNTNSSGSYTILTGLPAGNYFVRTNNSLGYVDEVYNNITCAPCSVTTGTPVAVTVGATTSGINFALAVGGQISGTVTDAATAAPLVNVNVQVFNSTGAQVTSVNTNSSGNYAILTGLLAGNYFVRTNNSLGYVNELYNNITCAPCNVTTGSPVAVSTGAITSGISFALDAGGKISGTVTDAGTTAPIANINVQVFNSTGASVTSVNTNTLGEYTILTGLLAGNYFVRTNNSLGYVDEVYNDIPCAPCNATSGTAVSVTAGATTSGINFALALGGLISGTVTDAATAAPLVNVNVQVFNSIGAQVTSVNTNSSGSYTILTGLLAGNYFVRTNNSLGYVNELYNNITCAPCNVTSGTPIAVTAGTTTSGIDFALAVGGLISGSVTDAATSLPIANVPVQIRNTSGAVVANANTNPSGNYTLGPGLPAGTYFARTNSNTGYINEIYNNIDCMTCNQTSGTPIAVTAGSTTSGINFTLTAGGRISGTVSDSTTTAPLQDISVEIYNSAGAFVFSVGTDSAGNYITGQGLLAGNYFVRTSSEGYINELYNNISCAACPVTSGTPVAVISGATTSGIDFGLSAGGLISGTVTDAATSAPIANAQVDINNSCGQFVTAGVTDASGNYVIFDGLPTGNYFARTTRTPNHIKKLYNNISCVNCDVTTGTPISVTAGATTSGINFALDRGGTITGMVTDAATGGGLLGVGVNIADSTGVILTIGTTDIEGKFTSMPALPTGNYFASTANGHGYINKVYNDITCMGCSATVGTPITVTAGATTSGINFSLNLGGRIYGTLTNASTSAPLQNTNVQTYDSAGTLVTTTTTDSSGNYISRGGLPTGNYFVRTVNSQGLIDEVFDNIECAGCVVTTGTAIAVTLGATTNGINFAIGPGGRISGAVTNAATSNPLIAIPVQIYNASGALVTTSLTDCSGSYTSLSGLPTGTYYARTASTQGFGDVLYNNFPCTNCDPTTGTAIPVTSSSTTSEINFALCQITLFPTSGTFSSRGGAGSFDLTVPGGCSWIAATTDSWIVLTSAPLASGNGTVTYEVRDNLAAASRAGTITIGGQVFSILQEGTGSATCTYSISPLSASFNVSGGTGAISVTTPSGCVWAATSNASWLTLTSGSAGTGNGQVNYVVGLNSSGSPRKATITVAGQKFNVKQKGS